MLRPELPVSSVNATIGVDTSGIIMLLVAVLKATPAGTVGSGRYAAMYRTVDDLASEVQAMTDGLFLRLEGIRGGIPSALDTITVVSFDLNVDSPTFVIS